MVENPAYENTLKEGQVASIAIVISPSNTNPALLEMLVSNLTNTLRPIAKNAFLITGNYPEFIDGNIRLISTRPSARLNVIKEDEKPTFSQFLNHVFVDFKMVYILCKIRKHVEFVMYHVGAKAYPFSMLAARLLGKKVVIFSFNPLSKVMMLSLGASQSKFIVTYNEFLRQLERFAFFLAKAIWVETESIITFGGFDRYKDKINVCGTPYVDTSIFKQTRRVKDRRNLVGFMASLERRKGIMNFIAAVPLVLAKRKDVEFQILSRGPLFSKITDELKNEKYENKVRLFGWIERNKIPGYLNELKAFVLPSYSEGLPMVIKEAMACGTPVLVTAVGGIPDIVKEGETGFILEDNSPECIARTILMVLDHPRLDDISINSRRLVQEKYSYEAVVRQWRETLGKLIKSKAN